MMNYFTTPSTTLPQNELTMSSSSPTRTTTSTSCSGCRKRCRPEHDENDDNDNFKNILMTTEDAETCTQTVTKQARVNKVSFDPQVKVIEASIQLTDEDIENTWWSAEHQRARITQTKKNALYYRQERPDYCQRYYQVLCCSVEYSRCQNHADTLKQNCSKWQQCATQVAQLSTSSARGFEKWIIPAIGFQRTRLVSSLMEAQSKLTAQAQSLSLLKPHEIMQFHEQKVQILATLSQSYTGPSAVMARWAGEGDAYAAMEQQQQQQPL